tara:strand:- start:4704 stop:5042 length:339 start_codon:yes stop_codon:yes gene_type:complete
MGWFDWFRRKSTRPIVADEEGKSPYEQAKEILSQDNKKEDIISKKMEEATVELGKFEEAEIIKEVPKRARTAKGTYVSDDKSTPDVNEAWVGGKAPKPKRKTVKVKRTTKKK